MSSESGFTLKRKFVDNPLMFARWLSPSNSTVPNMRADERESVTEKRALAFDVFIRAAALPSVRNSILVYARMAAPGQG